jgi:hypothetical protein
MNDLTLATFSNNLHNVFDILFDNNLSTADVSDGSDIGYFKLLS